MILVLILYTCPEINMFFAVFPIFVTAVKFLCLFSCGISGIEVADSLLWVVVRGHRDARDQFRIFLEYSYFWVL
jgi:hypothetical protein